jgi:hypothetical protein
MTIGRCCLRRRHHGAVKRGAPSLSFFLWRAMQGWVKIMVNLDSGFSHLSLISHELSRTMRVLLIDVRQVEAYY